MRFHRQIHEHTLYFFCFYFFLLTYRTCRFRWKCQWKCLIIATIEIILFLVVYGSKCPGVVRGCWYSSAESEWEALSGQKLWRGGPVLTGVAPETIGMVFCATICSEMALLNISSLIWRMKDLLLWTDHCLLIPNQICIYVLLRMVCFCCQVLMATCSDITSSIFLPSSVLFFPNRRSLDEVLELV